MSDCVATLYSLEGLVWSRIKRGRPFSNGRVPKWFYCLFFVGNDGERRREEEGKKAKGQSKTRFVKKREWRRIDQRRPR